jgi:hypothetical protein
VVLLFEPDERDELFLFLTDEPDLDDEDRLDEDLDLEVLRPVLDDSFRRTVLSLTAPEDLLAFEELSVSPLRPSRLLSLTESPLRRKFPRFRLSVLMVGERGLRVSLVLSASLARLYELLVRSVPYTTLRFTSRSLVGTDRERILAAGSIVPRESRLASLERSGSILAAGVLFFARRLFDSTRSRLSLLTVRA